MRALAVGLFLAAICSEKLLGQEPTRLLEEVELTVLQPPSYRSRGIDPVDSPAPRTFGIFTLIPPTGRGEMIRVVIPVGDLVSRAATRVAAANRRRQEAAARRDVQAALDRFNARASKPGS